MEQSLQCALNMISSFNAKVNHLFHEERARMLLPPVEHFLKLALSSLLGLKTRRELKF